MQYGSSKKHFRESIKGGYPWWISCPFYSKYLQTRGWKILGEIKKNPFAPYMELDLGWTSESMSRELMAKISISHFFPADGIPCVVCLPHKQLLQRFLRAAASMCMCPLPSQIPQVQVAQRHRQDSTGGPQLRYKLIW